MPYDVTVTDLFAVADADEANTLTALVKQAMRLKQACTTCGGMGSYEYESPSGQTWPTTCPDCLRET